MEYQHGRRFIVWDTNMAAVTLCENTLYNRHLHDGVILLLRPESCSFFLSYLNFVIPVRFE